MKVIPSTTTSANVTRPPHRLLLPLGKLLLGLAALVIAAACSRPDGRALIPARADLVLHVRPEAMLRSQLTWGEMASPAFWALMKQRRRELSERFYNGQLILGDFWAFTVAQVPGHWFFVFPEPEQLRPESPNPSFRTAQVPGQPWVVAVYSSAGPISRQGAAYLEALAGRQVQAWQPPAEVEQALRQGSHLTLYSNATEWGKYSDSSLFSGQGVASLFFADGVARGKLHFLPSPRNLLAGRRLLAPKIGLRPVQTEVAGSQISFSLEPAALRKALAGNQTWRGLSLMADFMGVPAAELLASSGQSVYAHLTQAGSLALASIEDADRARRALVRMRRRGALAGTKPPYELMGQPDWSLQTRAGRIEIRQGKAPAYPTLVACQGQGAWARLDSAGLLKAATLADLHRHPLARLMLPWMRSLELNLQNLPDGTFAGGFTFRHHLRLADRFKEGRDPLADFFEAGLP